MGDQEHERRCFARRPAKGSMVNYTRILDRLRQDPKGREGKSKACQIASTASRKR